MAKAMWMSFHMAAQTQDLPGLPLALRRWQKARLAGLKDRAYFSVLQGQTTLCSANAKANRMEIVICALFPWPWIPVFPAGMTAEVAHRVKP